jgi:hypothetical protein
VLYIFGLDVDFCALSRFYMIVGMPFRDYLMRLSNVQLAVELQPYGSKKFGWIPTYGIHPKEQAHEGSKSAP